MSSLWAWFRVFGASVASEISEEYIIQSCPKLFWWVLMSIHFFMLINQSRISLDSKRSYLTFVLRRGKLNIINYFDVLFIPRCLSKLWAFSTSYVVSSHAKWQEVICPGSSDSCGQSWYLVDLRYLSCSLILFSKITKWYNCCWITNPCDE